MVVTVTATTMVRIIIRMNATPMAATTAIPWSSRLPAPIALRSGLRCALQSTTTEDRVAPGNGRRDKHGLALSGTLPALTRKVIARLLITESPVDGVTSTNGSCVDWSLASKGMFDPTRPDATCDQSETLSGCHAGHVRNCKLPSPTFTRHCRQIVVATPLGEDPDRVPRRHPSHSDVVLVG